MVGLPATLVHQDAAGQCLTHVEHIIGQDRDVQTAIRLAKRMIVDGRMSTPEEAQQQLRQRQERNRSVSHGCRSKIASWLDDDWTMIKG
jgi:hypothetical protein